MNKRLLSTIFIIFSFCCFSQNPVKIIDSLKQVVDSKPKDSITIKAYSDLCWYHRNVSIDSAFSYGNLALKLSEKTKNKIGEAQAYNDIGILHYDLAEYPKAINVYQKSLKIRQRLNDSLGVASLYNKMGLVYQNTFKMDSAIFYATKALHIYEAKNNIRYAIALRNNIANIHKGLKQYRKALDAHLEIAKINTEVKDDEALVKSYNNIANAYLFLKDTINSISYYRKGIELAEKRSNRNEMATLYNNYGSLLQSKNEIPEAIKFLNKSLKLRQELNDNYGISSTSLHLAGLYLDFGELNKVEKHLRLGLKLSEESGANELKIDAYDKFTTFYAIKKNTDSVIYYKELFKALKDTVFSKQVIKEVTEVQEKYNASEREKEILSQRADLAEKELNITRKNTQLTGLGVLAIVISILGYLLFNQQKLKNQQLKREVELKEALVKIETQNRLQEQRLRISRDLHDNIGAQLTFIISSIENLQYGFKITNDKLNNKLLTISGFARDTIYELRDTIWAMNKSEIYLEDLQSRISNFIDKADISLSLMKFEFHIDESLSKDLVLTSVQGMNIYRIIQEAINNAIKYSKAKTVSVNIFKTNQSFQIEIKDDGNGFDVSSQKEGNGLNNMRKRATEIEASINIESKINMGTQLTINIPY
ncbi:MAG: sensor histidine kinase [Algibacter sp.]|uniref:tetratricopeptide repeat-containing sensor histidine kinase n=1 Tax=Algibacter sp. TaxID=1872428 RepID=UPI002629023D|nr:sensor histidine kinase [Algibacter sp.]MDG1730681.1 sensor histidine kinase [Algibacter sp.]MDG2177632.1 sensor histidine kinase [Algibacter sp.]